MKFENYIVLFFICILAQKKEYSNNKEMNVKKLDEKL